MGDVVMNLYEAYEALLGVLGGFENFLKNVRSGRLFLLHFASCPSYFQLCEEKKRPFALLRASFMKFMKMYEGGVLNGFFAICSSFPAQVMKLENAVSSWKFINALPPPALRATSPILGERQNGGGRAEVCCGV